MFLPALACVSVCLSVCLWPNNYKIVDGIVPNFMGIFLGEKGRPSSCSLRSVEGCGRKGQKNSGCVISCAVISETKETHIRGINCTPAFKNVLHLKPYIFYEKLQSARIRRKTGYRFASYFLLSVCYEFLFYVWLTLTMLRFCSYKLRFYWFYICAFVENTFAFSWHFCAFIAWPCSRVRL